MALEKITTLSWFFQLLILVGVAAIMVFGVEMLYFRDMTKQIDQQQTQLAAMKSDLANVALVANRRRMFQDQNANLERQLVDLRSVLPASADVDVLIRQLQDIAYASNVKLLRLAAKQTTSREAPAPGPAAPGGAAAGKGAEVQPQPYNEIGLTLELTGTYGGAGMFFDRVAHLQRIVNVSDLAVSSVADPAKAHLKAQAPKGLGDTVVASCTVTTYYQSEP